MRDSIPSLHELFDSSAKPFFWDNRQSNTEHTPYSMYLTVAEV